MSPAIVHAPLLFAREDEVWEDDDFDLPEGDSIIQHIEGHGSNINSPPSVSGTHQHKPARPTTLRMSTGPDEHVQDGDSEDWDLNNLDIPASSSATASSVTLVGTVNKLNKPHTGTAVVEDWDTDLDFAGGKQSMATVGSSARARSQPIAVPSWDVQGDDDIDDDDGGNASTIKVSRLPLMPNSATASHIPPSPVTTSANTSAGSITSSNNSRSSNSTTYFGGSAGFREDDNIEDAFALPSDLSHLSLKPLTRRTSKSTLEWSSDTTSSILSEAPSSLGFGCKATKGSTESPSSLPESEFMTDEEEAEVEGLVLPDSFLPKNLVRMLESKKRMGPQALARSSKVDIPNADNDFESGLIIDNDSELSPSRLREAGVKPRSTKTSGALSSNNASASSSSISHYRHTGLNSPDDNISPRSPARYALAVPSPS